MTFEQLPLDADAVEGRYATVMSDRATFTFKPGEITPKRTESAREELATTLLKYAGDLRTRYTRGDAYLNAVANVAVVGAPLHTLIRDAFALAFVYVYAWDKRPNDTGRLYTDALKARQDLRDKIKDAMPEIRQALTSVAPPAIGYRTTTARTTITGI